MACIGQIICGKYEIRKLLSEGGMSRVYLGRDIVLGKLWAIKEIINLHGKDACALAMQEAEAFRDLDHPAIVRLVEVLRDENAAYIIEDLVTGMTLGDVVHSGSFHCEKEIVRWMSEVCEALIYLHSRKPAVIYRDLKPDNIIITESGHIKLVDFGTARNYKPGKDRDTKCLGTISFAAPEQYEDYGSQTDERTDIYGFGCTMRYAGKACPELSEGFMEIVKKCTRMNPEDRYQDTGALMSDLDSLLMAQDRDITKVSIWSRCMAALVISLCAVVCILFSVVVVMNADTGNGGGQNDISGYSSGLRQMRDFIKYAVNDEKKASFIIDACELAADFLRESALSFAEEGIPAEEMYLFLDDIYQELAGLTVLSDEEVTEQSRVLEKIENIYIYIRDIAEN